MKRGRNNSKNIVMLSRKDSTFICGSHSIYHALLSRECYTLFVADNFFKNIDKSMAEAIENRKKQGMIVETVSVDDIKTAFKSSDMGQQKCVLEAAKKEILDFKLYYPNLMAPPKCENHGNATNNSDVSNHNNDPDSPKKTYHLNKSQTKKTIVILDQVTDSHNLGAIIRSSAVFGIDALIIPYNNSANPNNLATAKSACGGLEYIDIVQTVNLTQTINILKKQGFWCVGMDEKSNSSLTECKKLKFPNLAIIFGAEGRGIRSLVLKNCDLVCKIDTCQTFTTLNVSNAVAITLHALISNF